MHCLPLSLFTQTPLLEEKHCFRQSHFSLPPLLLYPLLHTDWSQNPLLCTSQLFGHFVSFSCCCFGLGPIFLGRYSLRLTSFAPGCHLNTTNSDHCECRVVLVNTRRERPFSARTLGPALCTQCFVRRHHPANVAMAALLSLSPRALWRRRLLVIPSTHLALL